MSACGGGQRAIRLVASTRRDLRGGSAGLVEITRAAVYPMWKLVSRLTISRSHSPRPKVAIPLAPLLRSVQFGRVYLRGEYPRVPPPPPPHPTPPHPCVCIDPERAIWCTYFSATEAGAETARVRRLAGMELNGGSGGGGVHSVGVCSVGVYLVSRQVGVCAELK